MLELQQHVARYWRRRRRRNWPRKIAVVFLALAGCWFLLAAVGTSHFVLVHVFYLPVLLAATWLGPVAGGLVGVGAGLMAGPLLPEHLIPQGYTGGAWMYRLAFFVTFGVLVGVLMERIYLQSVSLRRLYARTLRGFVQVLEHKDEETGEHCERVASNAVLLGRHLGLGSGDLEALYWSGYLHDVGKIATPAHILAKPGALTDEEYEVVKRHTVVGGDVLAHVSGAFEHIAEGVRHHHEKWDGSGYPDGLAGEAIPLFGRILAVVDVFEALTSERPYRKALPEEQAAGIVRDGIGSHFDPRVAHAFLALVAADRVHLEGRHGRRTAGDAPESFDPVRVGRARGRPGVGRRAPG